VPMNLVVSISDLRKVTNFLFDHIEKDLHISTVPIEEDYYWDIPTAELYNVLRDPPQLGIGQLYDDGDFLAKLKAKEDAPSLMMIHLAPLLRYVGEKIGQ
jgi:hypothetical protein